MGLAVEQAGKELQKSFKGIVKFDIDGAPWTLDLKSDKPSVYEGEPKSKADLIVKTGPSELAMMQEGKANAQQLFMKGKLKIKGNMGFAMKFNTVFEAARKKLKKVKPNKTAAAAPADMSNSAMVFEMIQEALPTQGKDLVSKMNATIQFNLGNRKWNLNLKEGNGKLVEGTGPADLTVTASDNDFFDIAMGKINPQQAFMKGKIKLKGNMALGLKLNTVLSAARPKAKL